MPEDWDAMFNSPTWATRIDMNIAAGVARAVSLPRLMPYGLAGQSANEIEAVARHGRNVEEARMLRNRVFHHEPITHYADLTERHRRLVELLGWFSPEARQHVEHLCRFTPVFYDRLVLRDDRGRTSPQPWFDKHPDDQ